MMKVLLCTVFKSARLADTYLYVDRKVGLERVPAELMASFGAYEEVLTFKLSPDRKLAVAEPEKVMSEIGKQGFYLQLPPQREAMFNRNYPVSGTR